MKRICLTALACLGFATALSGQVMEGNKIQEQPANSVTPGEITPYFWVGGQAIVTTGYNLQTGASGMAYNPYDTWVSFDVSFLDSHYSTPQKFETKDNPNNWSLYFKLYDMTTRLNSWTTTPEVYDPAWAVGVQGFGWKFGYFYENNLDSGLNTGGTTNTPIGYVPTALSGQGITGGNEILYLGQSTVANYLTPLSTAPTNSSGTNTAPDYLDSYDAVVQVSYATSNAVFATYQVPDYYKVSITAGSQTADTSTSARNAYAGVLNFSASPLGPGSLDEPVTFTVKGDLIAGENYSAGNPLGFGMQGELDYYLDDDVYVSPLVAFDGRLADTWTPGVVNASGTNNFDWNAGGGFLLTLSQKQWVTDYYDELPSQGSTAFQNIENTHILKFTYVQAMVDLSRRVLTNPKQDMDFVFKAEEPDGIVGIDDNLGAMVEYRALNLLRTNPGTQTGWAMLGRVDYDFVNHKVTPYVHWYVDYTGWTQLRVGVDLMPVKGSYVELTYMTTNLTGAPSVAADSGRFEVIFGLSTDTTFIGPRSMNFAAIGTEE